ncbi:MAG: MerR family transcriptional regulator [Chloroflexia bacterium]
MEKLTIGEVASKAGLRTSALRYYESVGLLAPPSRVSGQRRYDAEVLRHLLVIQVAQQAGFSVAEIKVLLYGFEEDVTPSVRWRAMAKQKLPEVESLIERANVMKRLLEEGLNCGCLNFQECVMIDGAGCSVE